MKELSIEEKAKAYDEAIQRAKNIYKDAIDMGENIRAKQCEVTFPELKESEDEKIRKVLIDYFNRYKEREECGVKTFYGIPTDNIIAWLEKQSEKKVSYTTTVGTGDGGINALVTRDIEIPFGAKDSKLKEATYFIPQGYYAEIEGDKVVMKQGEKKSLTIDIKSMVDSYEQRLIKNGGVSNSPLVNMCLAAFKRGVENTLDKLYLKQIFANSTKTCKDEQKPTDKIGSKFKVGDWVVNTVGDTNQVVKVLDDGYTLDDNTFLSNSWATEHYHLWTIQDAKDGDVLCYVTDEEDLWIMIYWSLYEPYEGHVHYHALLVNDNFSDKGTCCICINDLKPVTKEQCDLLFQKMKEAGYVWDAKNKELKKIENRPLLFDFFNAEYERRKAGALKCVGWSEEDEEFLRRAINATKDAYPMTANWLKSIKQRIGG